MKWSPEDWARLGVAIRSSREGHGFSRKKLAELSGISEKSIQLIEEGRVPSRWPKSLDVLERPLGWPNGSMHRVLDGLDLDVELSSNASTPAGGADYGADAVLLSPDGVKHFFDLKRHSGARGSKSGDEVVTTSPASWPPEIQDALPYVMFFGSNCVAHGAPEWLGRAFDNAVAALLKSLAGGDQQQLLELGEGGDGWRLNAAALPPRTVPIGQGGSHVETLIGIAQMEISKGPATPAKVRILQKSLIAKEALNEYVRKPNPDTQRAMLDTGFELNDELLKYHREQGWSDDESGAAEDAEGEER
ncbi:helix-turn-helix domain-containing protein [Streptomyces anandii]